MGIINCLWKRYCFFLASLISPGFNPVWFKCGTIGVGGLTAKRNSATANNQKRSLAIAEQQYE